MKEKLTTNVLRSLYLIAVGCLKQHAEFFKRPFDSLHKCIYAAVTFLRQLLSWRCAATLRQALLLINICNEEVISSQCFSILSLHKTGKRGAFLKEGREHPEKVNKMSQKKSAHNLWTSDKVVGAPGHPGLQTGRHQIITKTKGWMVKEPQNRTLIKLISMIVVNSGHLYTQLPVGVFSSREQDTPTYYCGPGLCWQGRAWR